MAKEHYNGKIICSELSFNEAYFLLSIKHIWEDCTKEHYERKI